MSHSPLVSVPGHENFVFTDFNFDACIRHYNTRAKNLIPSSEDMSDNFFWEYLNSATSIKNHARAPDSTFTSNLVQDPSIGSVSFIKETIAIENDSDDYVFSLFIKKGTSVDTQINMSFENGTFSGAEITMDWTTNKLSVGASVPDDYGSEYICDGWYRVWVLKRNNGLGNTQISIYLYPSVTTNEADVQMWGAQLEKSVSKPSHYVRTGGGVRVDGCYPRGENLLTYSEQFDNAAWIKANATITANSVSSPDNEATADTLNRTAAGDYFTYQVYATTAHANKTYTFGVWLRQGNYSDAVDITIREDTDATLIATASHVLSTRWQLVTVTGTFDGTPTADIRVTINPQDNAGSPGDTFYLWGASFAEGSVYKAYQKTEATAIIDGTGTLDNALKCYETFESCQSRDDYGSICRVVRVCQRGAQVPRWEGNHQGPPMYPFLEMSKGNPSFTSTKITPGKGLSQRGAVTVKYQDGMHHDRGLDPYYSDRTHDTSQGTFFGKLLSRNRHYHKRRFDVYTGYLDNGVYDPDNFEKRSYLIDVISGPDLNSKVSLTAKDSLFITDSSLKIPAANSGILIADQLAADLKFDLLLNQGAQYPRTGTVKIGKELVNYDYCGHNRITKSEEFDHANWTKTGLTSLAASTAVTNPFGDANSYLLTENSSLSLHQFSISGVGSIIGDSYTVSVYLQAHGSGTGYVYLAHASSTAVFFDVANGNLLSAESGDDYIRASIEDIDGVWYRCSVSYLSSTANNASIIIGASSTGSNTTYTGSGNAQFYAWAAGYNDGVTLGNYYKTDAAQFVSNDRIIVPSGGRGAYNTVAEDHSIDDSVQQCLVYNDNVVDILHDVFVNQSSIDKSVIPYNNSLTDRKKWDDEKIDWLSGHTFFGIIAEPTQVNQIIKELTLAAMCNIWVDEVADEILLRAIVPPRLNAPVKMLDEDSSITKDSFKYTRKEDMRRSRVMVVYDMINQVEGDDVDNFNKIYIQADPATEEFYGGSAKIEKIRSRWLSSQNTGQAAQLAGRTLARFIDAPKEATWSIHAKDEDLKTGDLVEVETPGLQDFYGAREVITFEILEKRELEPGETYELRGLESRFTGSYGFIGPNTLGEYSAESEDNKRKYAFICYDTGVFMDGSPAYKII